MSKIVELGAFRLTSKPRQARPEGCPHHRTTLDSAGETVTCDDCGLQVSAFWVLQQVMDAYTEQVHRLHQERLAVARTAASQLHLQAAQKVERAWRSRKMVPVCPHCDEPIFPEDGLGARMANRELALRRRTARKERA